MRHKQDIDDPDPDDDRVKTHPGCGGIVHKEWTGSNEWQYRCAFCKKVLPREIAIKLELPVPVVNDDNI